MPFVHRIMWPVYRALDLTAKTVLASPVHFLLSWQVVVIEFSGLKTGRRSRIGVNYHRSGDHLNVMTYRKRVWWRNLRGGRQVKVLYRGRRLDAETSVEESDLEAIRRALQERDLPRRVFFRVPPEEAVLVKLKLRSAPAKGAARA